MNFCLQSSVQTDPVHMVHLHDEGNELFPTKMTGRKKERFKYCA